MKPVRNPDYRQWVRSLPCCVCRTTRRIEAAHTGPRGLGQKSSDLSVIPLCARHHRTGKDSYHKLGPRKFAEVHRLNIPAIIAVLSAKIVIRIQSGAFIGRLGGEMYVLGSTAEGLTRAIQKMSRLRRELHTGLNRDARAGPAV